MRQGRSLSQMTDIFQTIALLDLDPLLMLKEMLSDRSCDPLYLILLCSLQGTLFQLLLTLAWDSRPRRDQGSRWGCEPRPTCFVSAVR